MGSCENFCLRWNDFEVNFSNALYDLKEEKDFSDVTLACADNQVEAHKVILAASSPFFKRILKENPHRHPLIYLKGIKYSDVEAVLKFIYQGEVNVEQANLETFLEVAEELEVKGLVPDKNICDGVGSKMLSSKPRTSMQLPTKQSLAPRSNIQSIVQTNAQHSSQTEQENSTYMNNNRVVHVKVESKDTITAAEPEQEQNDVESLNHIEDDEMQDSLGYGGVENDLHGYFSKVSVGQYQCNLCGKISSKRNHAFLHVEAIHFPGRNEYECDQCGKKLKSKHMWYHHRSKVHSSKKSK